MRNATPPRLAKWLLERVVPRGRSREGLIGDLEERFRKMAGRGRRGVLWYWAQALGAVARYGVEAARGPFRRATDVEHAVQDSVDTKTPVRRRQFMSGFGKDVIGALRVFRRNPGFAAIIALTLGLGVGANSAIFSVVNAVLLRPLPYGEGSSLVRLRQGPLNAAGLPTNLSPLEVADYQERASTLSDVVEYHTMFFNLLEPGQDPERVQVGVVSWNYFDVIGVPMIHGRSFAPEEDQIGANPVLIIGYDYWQRRFGGDPDVIGRSVQMNDHAHEIVGVLPPIPTYPNQNDVWMPWYACPFRIQDTWHLNRAARALITIARVNGDTEVQRVQAEVASIAGALHGEHPDAYQGVEEIGASVVPLKEELTAGARPTFLILLAMSGMVLLIACANVANLTLARMNRRQQELAVRSALGAGRARIVRQLVTESVVLSLAGATVAVGVAYLSVDALAAFASGLTPRFGEVRVDGWVLAFTGLLALATGVIVGTLPGVLSGGIMKPLRESKGSRGLASERVRRLLVASQVGVAFILLTGAGLMIRSFANLIRVDNGYASAGVLTVTVDLDWAQYTTPQEGRMFFRELLDRVASHPQVQNVGVASDFPMSGQTFQNQTRLLVEGSEIAANEQPPVVNQRFVSEGYFEALAIPLLRGRYFERTDDAQGAPVAILSATAASRFFAGEDPVGRRVSPDGGQTWATIVGVVGDVRQVGPEAELNEEIYASAFQGGFARRLLVRTSVPPASLAPTVADDIYSIDPDQPVSFVQTLEEAEAAIVSSPRTVTLLLSIFAAIALATAAAGILSVIAYSVSQRQKEIGIRLALGGRRGSVVSMLVREGIATVVLGLIIGVPIALLAGGVLDGLLFGVESSDPLTLLAMATVMLLVAVVATLLPAVRGTDVDPVVALNTE